jgi:hypothetical protein
MNLSTRLVFVALDGPVGSGPESMRGRLKTGRSAARNSAGLAGHVAGPAPSQPVQIYKD